MKPNPYNISLTTALLLLYFLFLGGWKVGEEMVKLFH